MKAKLLALVLCVSLILMNIAGCSTEEKTTGETSDSKAGASEESTSTSTDEGDDGIIEVVELRMMGYNAESTRATYLKYLDEQLPNIKIKFEFVSNENFDNILNAQLQAGNGPDIIEGGARTKLLAKAGYLLDISDQAFVSNYSNAGLQPYTVDGQVYATPLQSWYEGIFYNKTIFADNGIEVPKTWDEFLEIHRTLEANGIKAQTMGAQSWEPMMKQSMALANNEFYADPANKGYDERFNAGEVDLAVDWLPAVTEWYKIIEEGFITEDMLGLSYDQALDEFATEKAAMWESGPWSVGTIQEKNPDMEFGMFPIPGLDADKPGWLIGGPGSSFSVNEASENVEAALKVLEMTATAEAQKALVADNAGSSFVKGVEVDLGEIYDDCQEAFKAGNVYAPFTAVWMNGEAVIQGYGKSLQEVLSGVKTIEEALMDADAVNDELIEALSQ